MKKWDAIKMASLRKRRWAESAQKNSGFERSEQGASLHKEQASPSETKRNIVSKTKRVTGSRLASSVNSWLRVTVTDSRAR